LEETEIDDEWLWSDSNEENEQLTSSVIGELLYDEDEDEDLILYFAVNLPGLTQWEFHLADPDFFPSIPHGHEHGRDQPKLDPFIGWVYDKTKQIRREKRKTIVRLWNDDNFRHFARRAISFYLNTYSNYNGWRVSNPLRLPRKRRP
jgi:hypothetical protein